MTVLLRKEIRSLLPAWIVTMAATALIAFVRPNIANVLLFGVAIGCVLLGITSFGSEFSQGTFSVLLAQPIPRARIWWTKTMTLGVALLSVAVTVFVALATQFFNSGSNFRVDDVEMPAIFTLLFFGAAFAGGLLSALTIRQMATAFWIALLFPLGVCGVAGILTMDRSEKTINISIAASLAVYDVIAFLLARYQFLRAQDLPGASGTVISLPAWIRFGTKARSVTTAPSRRPLRALIAKEFQLHQVSLCFAAVLLVLHLIVLFIRRMFFVPVGWQKHLYELLLGCWWLLWFVIPVIIATAAVAEERRQGTLDGSLCLPARKSTQWFIKCAVCFFLALLFGGVMPWLLESTASLIGATSPIFQAPSAFPNHWQFLRWAVTEGAVITLVAFYASSLARSLLQAVGVGVLFASAFVWIAVHFFHFLPGDVFFQIGLPVLFVLLLWLSCVNFKHSTVGRRLWLGNISALLLVAVFLYGLTALLWRLK